MEDKQNKNDKDKSAVKPVIKSPEPAKPMVRQSSPQVTPPTPTVIVDEVVQR